MMITIGCNVYICRNAGLFYSCIGKFSEVENMGISYNGLWKLLIDKNMKKMDLVEEVGISSSTLAKLSKGEAVSMAVLEKLCQNLDCDFGDIVHYEKNKA